MPWLIAAPREDESSMVSLQQVTLAKATMGSEPWCDAMCPMTWGVGMEQRKLVASTLTRSKEEMHVSSIGGMQRAMWA